MPHPAVALLEFSSVAHGIAAGDAMVKAAPVGAIHAGSVQPGKYLVLVAGDTASVATAVEAGQATSASAHLATVFLPDIHPDVSAAIRGSRADPDGEALGIVETTTVSDAIAAADAGVKGAAVVLHAIRMADGLGGKGYALFAGPVAEVEAAIEIGSARVAPDVLIGAVVVPQLHAEMAANVWTEPRFRRVVASPDEVS